MVPRLWLVEYQIILIYSSESDLKKSVKQIKVRKSLLKKNEDPNGIHNDEGRFPKGVGKSK